MVKIKMVSARSKRGQRQPSLLLRFSDDVMKRYKLQKRLRLTGNEKPWWGTFTFNPEEMQESTDWSTPWSYFEQFSTEQDSEGRHFHTFSVSLSQLFLLSAAGRRFTIRGFENGNGSRCQFNQWGQTRVIRAEELMDLTVEMPRLLRSDESDSFFLIQSPPTFHAGPPEFEIRFAPLPEGPESEAERDQRIQSADLSVPFIDGAYSALLINTFLGRTVLDSWAFVLREGQPQEILDKPFPSLRALALQVISSVLNSPSVPWPAIATLKPDLAADPCAMRLLAECQKRLPAHQFLTLFEGSALSAVELQGYRYGAEALQWAATLPALQTLTLTEADQRLVVPPLLAPLQGLSSLTVQWSFFDVGDELWEALAALPHLLSLYCSTTFSQTVVHTATVCPAALAVVARLQVLQLAGFVFAPGALLQLLQAGRQLQQLSLEHSNVDDEVVAQLPVLCPALNAFNGCYTAISSAALRHFLELPQLQALRVSHSRGFGPSFDVATLQQLSLQLPLFHCLSGFHSSVELLHCEQNAAQEGRDVRLCVVVWKNVLVRDGRVSFLTKRLCSAETTTHNDWVGLFPREKNDQGYESGCWNWIRDLTLVSDDDAADWRSFSFPFPSNTSPGSPLELRYFRGSYMRLGSCSVKN